MNRRHWIYRNGWWLASLALLAGSVAILRSSFDGKGGLIASLVALCLGFVYFVQRQVLDELRLFKELFVDFNKRYNDLNDDLLGIREGRLTETAKIHRILVGYFNLCAEEFLFYKHRRIPRDVWRSWCRGMLFFLKHENIRPTLESEVAQDSYYGLTIEKIEVGAR